MKIIFICTGNTCRSPMAEAFLKDHKLTIENLEIISRGIAVFECAPANDKAIKVLLNDHNIVLVHQSKQITQADFDNADLIITMSQAHKKYLSQYGDGSKVYTLYEYAEGKNKDVGDPFGNSLEVYKKCAAEIKGLIDKMAEKLQK